MTRTTATSAQTSGERVPKRAADPADPALQKCRYTGVDLVRRAQPWLSQPPAKGEREAR
jgi:hypothetical protein